jgi:hypothetical protein
MGSVFSGKDLTKIQKSERVTSIERKKRETSSGREAS